MKCQGTTKVGKPCKFHAEANGYCKHHQNQKSEDHRLASESTKKDEAYTLAADRRQEDRARREGMGALPGQQMMAEKKPGFVRRWVNDESNNIDRRTRQGYSFVDEGNAATTDIGSAKSIQVSKQRNVETRAYLMEIPEEFYNEDQQEKENQIRRTETSIKEATAGGEKALERSVLYNPSEGNNQLLE